MQIVSLIPEATEILEALGLGDAVVAVSLDEARDPDRLTEILQAAQPSLIFTSETAAGGGVPRRSVRRVVARANLTPRPGVYVLEPTSLGAILSDIKTVGDAVVRQAASRALIEALRARIDAVSLRSAHAVAEIGARRVVCLTGVDPPTTAGAWLAELIGLAGGIDALDGVGRPTRVVTWGEIAAARPDLVVCVESDMRSPSPPTLPRGLFIPTPPLRRTGEGVGRGVSLAAGVRRHARTRCCRSAGEAVGINRAACFQCGPSSLRLPMCSRQLAAGIPISHYRDE